MSIARRALLASLAVTVVGAGGLSPSGAADADPLRSSREGSVLDRLCPEVSPVLDLRNQNTGEELAVRFYGPSGYEMDGIARLVWFFRDWREAEIREINPRLYWGLAVLRQAIIQGGSDGRIVITSGYRTRRTNDRLPNTARNSLHLIGCAVDFWIPGVSVNDLGAYVERLEVGGTGYYPNSGFVHMDTGRERQWRG